MAGITPQPLGPQRRRRPEPLRATAQRQPQRPWGDRDHDGIPNRYDNRPDNPVSPLAPDQATTTKEAGRAREAPRFLFRYPRRYREEFMCRFASTASAFPSPSPRPSPRTGRSICRVWWRMAGSRWPTAATASPCSARQGEGASLGLNERQRALGALVGAGIDPASAARGRHRRRVGRGCDRAGPRRPDAGLPELPAGAAVLLQESGRRGPVRLARRRARPASGPKASNVILYHIPQVTSVGLSVELIDRLKKAFPNQVNGVKDSSGELGEYRGAARSITATCTS